MKPQTCEEKSLLLFLETQAVDYRGRVDARHMNKNDLATAKRWSAEGYLLFGRMPIGAINKRVSHRVQTHWVVLLPAAQRDAAECRAERADRGEADLREFLEPYADKPVVAPLFVTTR